MPPGLQGLSLRDAARVAHSPGAAGAGLRAPSPGAAGTGIRRCQEKSVAALVMIMMLVMLRMAVTMCDDDV